MVDTRPAPAAKGVAADEDWAAADGDWPTAEGGGDAEATELDTRLQAGGTQLVWQQVLDNETGAGAEQTPAELTGCSQNLFDIPGWSVSPLRKTKKQVSPTRCPRTLPSILTMC